MHLNQKISDIANNLNIDNHRISRLLAQIATLEMIDLIHPDLLQRIQIKGGTGLVIKYGLTNSRFTRDLDLTMPDRNQFLEILPKLTGTTWCGFSIGKYLVRDIYAPAGISVEHSVQRIDLQLQFLKTKWLTTKIDLTNHENMGDFQLEQADFHQEISFILDSLSLSVSSRYSLISAESQVAEKLHALTQIDSGRGRDLYDIHLVMTQNKLDLNLTKELFLELINQQNTPLVHHEIAVTDSLLISYKNAVEGMQAPDFKTALEESNQLLVKIIETDQL